MGKKSLKGTAKIVNPKTNQDFKISNWQVFDLHESIKASGYPKTVDVDAVDYSEKRAEKLADVPPASGHDCFLKGILVNADIKATIKWWVQFERYHFADIISSQSTMHKITEMDFEGCFNSYVTEYMKEEMKQLKDEYNENQTRENYLKLIYNNPVGMLLTARVTFNYLQLKNMYKQRKNHKLPEWSKFCKWVEQLPKSHLITGSGGE